MRNIILISVIALTLSGCSRSKGTSIILFDIEEVRAVNQGTALKIVAYKHYDDMGVIIRCEDFSCVGEPIYESDNGEVSLYIDTTIYHRCSGWYKVYVCLEDSSPCVSCISGGIILITLFDTVHITDSLRDTLYCKRDTFYYEDITTCQFQKDDGFVPVALINASGDSIYVRGEGKMFFLPYTGGHLAPLPPDGYVSSYALPLSGRDTVVFWYDSDGNRAYSVSDAFGTFVTTGTALSVVYTRSTGFRGITTSMDK